MASDGLLKLKIALLERGYKQREFAQLVGLSETYISNIIRGAHVPAYETRLRIAHALDAKASDFWPDEHDADLEMAA